MQTAVGFKMPEGYIEITHSTLKKYKGPCYVPRASLCGVSPVLREFITNGSGDELPLGEIKIIGRDNDDVYPVIFFLDQLNKISDRPILFGNRTLSVLLDELHREHMVTREDLSVESSIPYITMYECNGLLRNMALRMKGPKTHCADLLVHIPDPSMLEGAESDPVFKRKVCMDLFSTSGGTNRPTSFYKHTWKDLPHEMLKMVMEWLLSSELFMATNEKGVTKAYNLGPLAKYLVSQVPPGALPWDPVEEASNKRMRNS